MRRNIILRVRPDGEEIPLPLSQEFALIEWAANAEGQSVEDFAAVLEEIGRHNTIPSATQ